MPNKTTTEITFSTGTLHFKANGDAVLQKALDQMIIFSMDVFLIDILNYMMDELNFLMRKSGRDCLDTIELSNEIKKSEMNVF
uniref:Uncharacterized protein n=1 Tax=Strongyloides papillosus TaxID=174720 RepID=A0A0N5CIV3_STREA